VFFRALVSVADDPLFFEVFELEFELLFDDLICTVDDLPWFVLL
jgi:hypothetical protein